MTHLLEMVREALEALGYKDCVANQAPDDPTLVTVHVDRNWATANFPVQLSDLAKGPDWFVSGIIRGRSNALKLIHEMRQ